MIAIRRIRSRRHTAVILSPLWGVLLLAIPSQVRGDGLVPIYSSPVPQGVALLGFACSATFALVGIAVAVKRTGWLSSAPVALACVVAILTVLICLRELIGDSRPGALSAAGGPAAVGLSIFGVFIMLWCVDAIRTGARIRQVVLLLTCAIGTAAGCMLLLWLAVDHWEDPYIPADRPRSKVVGRP